MFPVWFPLFLLVFLLSILALLFPYRLSETIVQAEPDQVSVAYLRSMLARHPQDRLLRESLIKHYSALGKTERALYELATLMVKENDSELLLWKMELMHFQFFKLDKESKAQQVLGADILRLVQGVLLDDALDVIQLERVVVVCQSLAWYGLVADIYQRLAQKVSQSQEVLETSLLLSLVDFFLSPVFSEERSQAEVYALKSLDGLKAVGFQGKVSLERVGELVESLPNSDYLLRAAMNLSLSWGEVRQSRNWGRRYLERFFATEQHYQQQLTLELSADEPQNSLQWVREQLKQHSHTKVLLGVAVRLALAAGDLSAAQAWGQEQLLLVPDDRALRLRQVELEMKFGDTKGALEELLLLLQQTPDDRALRRKAAQLAEWSGDFKTALTQWIWLSDEDPFGSDARQGLLLAKQLADHQAVLDLLLRRSQRRALSEQELKELVLRYQLLKQPQQAIERLTQLRRQYPQQHSIYDHLLALYHGEDNLRDALSLLMDMEIQFGVVQSDLIKKARLLMDLGHMRSAWILLKGIEEHVSKERSEFWHLYADIAMRLEKKEVAKRSYAVLSEQNKIDQYESYQYLVLLQPDLTTEEFIKLSEHFWARFKEPSFLLLAMDSAHRHGLWAVLQRLLSSEASPPQLLSKNASYWLIKSALAQHQGYFFQAKYALRKAVKLNPLFEKDLLWLLINLDDKAGLRTLLLRLRKDVGQRSELWPVMASAYLHLQRPKEALIWYRKSVPYSKVGRLTSGLERQIINSLEQIPTGLAVTLRQRQVADYFFLSRSLHSVASIGKYTLLSNLNLNKFDMPDFGLQSQNDPFETQVLLKLKRRWLNAETELGWGSIKNGTTAVAQFSAFHFLRGAGGAYQVKLFLRELSHESMLFRFVGLKDSLLLQGQWEFGVFDSITLRLAGHRYNTRWSEALGNGMEIRGRWGHRFQLIPQIRTEVYLHRIENELIEKVPHSVQIQLEAPVEISSLLAEKSLDMGGNFVFQQGVETFWGYRYSNLSYRVKAGVFSNGVRAGYRLNAALAGTVFGKDNLHLGFAYSDVSDGVEQGASVVVEGRYSYRFD